MGDAGDEGRGEAAPAKSRWARRRLRRKRNRTGIKFKLADLKAHLQEQHPNCPEQIRHELYRLLRQRCWTVSIGQAVGITIQNFVRHELTDYERLYRTAGLTQTQARRAVKAEVCAIIAGWGRRQGFS